MHPNSELLFRKHALPFFLSTDKVLEIGPGEIPSPYQLMSAYHKWHTLDIIPDRHPDFVAWQAYQFPLADNSYDIVLSGQVIEHVAKIWRWMPELARVCKKGGYVITINPVSWEYHPDPLDCWRIYPDGMKALYEDAGLTINLSLFETNDGVTDTITIGSKE